MPAISTTILRTLVYDIAMHNCEASYKKLFGLLFRTLFQFSLSMLHSREAAEEVASDVMFKLWQKRAALLQVENIQVYALVMVRNLSLNVLKRTSANRIVSLEQVNVQTAGRTTSPEQILIDAQNKATLESCINALPTRCRLVFTLIKEERLSYKQVADVLNISPKTVDAHLVTAMKRLAQALKNSFTALK